jgi:hypothetical protein
MAEVKRVVDDGTTIDRHALSSPPCIDNARDVSYFLASAKPSTYNSGDLRTGGLCWFFGTGVNSAGSSGARNEQGPDAITPASKN